MYVCKWCLLVVISRRRERQRRVRGIFRTFEIDCVTYSGYVVTLKILYVPEKYIYQHIPVHIALHIVQRRYVAQKTPPFYDKKYVDNRHINTMSYKDYYTVHVYLFF